MIVTAGVVGEVCVTAAAADAVAAGGAAGADKALAGIEGGGASNKLRAVTNT